MGSIIGTLLPVLERAENGSEIKIISHQFQYAPGWNADTQFYKELERLLTTETASIKLLGGMPPLLGDLPFEEPYRDNLKNLYDLGAEVQILDIPPTAHPFIYNSPTGKNLIWFESHHENGGATGIAHTSKPSDKDTDYANKYFDAFWEKGTPFAEVGISE